MNACRRSTSTLINMVCKYYSMDNFKKSILKQKNEFQHWSYHGLHLQDMDLSFFIITISGICFNCKKRHCLSLNEYI